MLAQLTRRPARLSALGNAFGHHEARYRSALAQCKRRRVFGRFVPRLQALHRRELDDDEALRLPRSFERLGAAAAREEAAAERRDRRADRAPVFGVTLGVDHFDVSDEIS